MAESPVIPDADRSPSPDRTGRDEGTIAVYAFHPFSDEELAEIAKACEEDGFENGGNEDFIKPAPQPRFLDEDATVENVVRYHRALVKTKRYRNFCDKSYLIIAKSPDWKKEGVLLVTLNKYDLLDIPDDGVAFQRGWDSWMFTAQSSGLNVLNLQIANMSWLDFTGWDETQPEGQEVDGREGQTWSEMHGSDIEDEV